MLTWVSLLWWSGWWGGWYDGRVGGWAGAAGGRRPGALRGPAAVHEVGLAVDGVGAGTAQEGDQAGHLVGLDEPLHRRAGQQDLVEDPALGDAVTAGLVGDLALDERGAHVARAHRVAGDAPVGPLQRDDLGEPLQAVLGADVGGLVRRGAVAVRPREMCTMRPQPALVHAGQHGAGQQERGVQHHPVDELEGRGVEVLHRGHVLQPGVVHQDVDTALGEPQVGDVVGVGEVGDEVLAPDLDRDLLDALLVAVEQQDVGAVGRQPGGDGTADAARGTGPDEGRPAVQGRLHGV